ncbi:sensor histidine kinase [Actinophytocola algeriensis]|uniref:histidine kinase n=1 Tax=Actinophytocola algeriensis TaxID=1768010 RepID=A0A7W7Q2L3_9PSEU|nr:nitrate- and nitrite sensing domain-containing protein [Actinophytocola algeriensis]MBB4905812.1 signal transduction histidine kinase [Actinophytocola algeriensis]MBE1472503.1 signal transduction histidine kinase [Actinophytocola algeriensis]
MSLARKLALLVAVPLIAVVGFAALALSTSVGQAVDSGRLADEVSLGRTAGALTRDLHRERLASLAMLQNPPTDDQRAEFRRLAGETDAHAAEYRTRRAALSVVPDHFADVLGRIDTALADLPGLREQVLSGEHANLSAITFRYRITAADLATLRERVSAGAPAELTGDLRAAAQLSRITEYIGLQEIAVLRAAADPYLSPAMNDEVRAARAGVVDAAYAFSQGAPAAWRDWYDRARVGEDATAVQVLDDGVARTQPGQKVVLDAAAWTAAMNAHLDRLGAVEQRVDDAVVASVEAHRDGQVLRTLIQAAIVVATLAAAVALAIWLGTPMIRGLRGLRSAAHTAAYESLPIAVFALRGRNALGNATPKEYADAHGDAVAVRGTDEIAQVGKAFNELNHSAIHLAAQQAALRDQMDSMFVALARRAERLTSALIAQVDLTERGEQDPDRLAALFTLDHLATRMRRTNNSLLILGGEGSARVRKEPMTCHDLLGAAVSQIARYQQVDLHSEVDQQNLDRVVASEMTDHLAHLFAELIDNATAFSSPNSRVTVVAAPAGDGVVVTVTDKGLGFAPDALAAARASLADPDQNPGAVRAMGLAVVGRIASWYGIDIEIRSEPKQGTVVKVGLPPRVFTRRADFDWFHGQAKATAPSTIATTPAKPEQAPAAGADQRDSAKISGVMTAFARGIGAHRSANGKPDRPAPDLVEKS